MLAPVLMFLAKEIGPTFANEILARLGTIKGANGKLQRALEATQKGMSIVAALKAEFGEGFSKAVTEAISRAGTPDWSYEAGQKGYIHVDSKGVGGDKVVQLRDELNMNLDRLAIFGKQADGELRNYFRGVFGVWKSRYSRILGLDDEARAQFLIIDQLLDVGDRTFKDVVELLAKTSLGVGGALMLISGVLLATSTGVGLVTVITTFLVGIPWVSVALLVIPGSILMGLARYKFGEKHAMSTCVSIAYKMLDQRSSAVIPSRSRVPRIKPVKKSQRTKRVSKISKRKA